jgi:hypothetical protein
MITISGNGFGAKKGKVLIEDPSLGIKAPLKLAKDGWTDTSIKGIISKALPTGVYNLTVLPKTKPPSPITLEASFFVMRPEIESVSPPNGNYKTEVTVTGKYFGNKKGKVSLSHVGGDARKGWICTIKKDSWWMDTVTGGSSITFIMPCGLPDGDFDVSIMNQTGLYIKGGVFTKSGGTETCPISTGKTVCPPDCAGW